MRLKTTITFLSLFLITAISATAQVFWTEKFSTACASLRLLPYTSGNGTWTWVSTGTNGANANTFYVSLTESDPGRTMCSTSSTTGSLHVGNVSTSPAAALFCPTGDCGAAYDATNNTCTANARATSPVINCTGQNNITLSFNYIMGGQAAHDYATVWYYNGSIWSLLASPAMTATCPPQGIWTHYTVALPASANNNPNVQIGFNWQNNGDGLGNDPSFAVDSVQLSQAVVTPPVADFTCNDSVICIGDSVHFQDLSTGAPTSWLWTFTGGSPATSSAQNPVIYYGAAGTYTVKEVVQNINGKDSITKVNYIHVVAGPAVTISPNTTICADSTLTLTAGGGGTYAWSTGATTSSITVTPNSTTTYTLGVSNGTCTKDTQVTVTVNPRPVITFTGNTPLCKGDSTLITATGGGTYVWSNGATTSSIEVKPSASSTFSVTVTNGGCKKDSSFTVTINPAPTVTLSGNTAICTGQTATVTATGGGTYAWSNGATTSSISITPTGDSTINLVVSNGGCTKDTSVKITVGPKPTVTMGPTETTCQGTPVNLSASGGTTYLWHPNNSLNDSTIANPIATPSVTTEYTVDVSNGGCIVVDSEKVIVNPVLPVSASASPSTITSGQQSNLNVTPGASYLWSPASTLTNDTIQNPVALPTVTTWYYVFVTEADGCVVKDSVLVTVNEKCGEVFIPTAFSPANPGGANTILYVRCNPACVSGFAFKVFDRWGNAVFTTSDPTQGWDGSYNGQPMNAGTYVWYLNYIDVSNNNNGVATKGNVTLVR